MTDDPKHNPGDDAVEQRASGGSPFFTVTIRDGIRVITLLSSLLADAEEVERVGDDIERYVQDLEKPRVVIDLDFVQHLSSAALGMLITMKTTVEHKGGALCVANVGPNLRDIFTATRLDLVLKMHESVDEGVAGLE